MPPERSGILFVTRELSIGGGTIFLKDIIPSVQAAGIPAYVLAGRGRFADSLQQDAEAVWNPLGFQFWPAHFVRAAINRYQPAAVLVNKLKWGARIVRPCHDAGVPLFVRYNVDSVEDSRPPVRAAKPLLADIFVVCQVLAEPLRQDPHLQDKLRWLPTPVADELIAQEPTPPPADGFILVSGNRASRLKGQGVLAVLDLMPRLTQAIPGFQLVILGGGSLTPECRARAQTLNREHGREVVNVVGLTSEPYRYMRQGHCVIGSAHVAHEALALGRHLISCGFKGFPRYVSPDNIEECLAGNFGDFDYAYDFAGVDRDRMLREIIKAYQACRREPINRSGREHILAHHTGQAVTEVLINGMRELGTTL